MPDEDFARIGFDDHLSRGPDMNVSRKAFGHRRLELQRIVEYQAEDFGMRGRLQDFSRGDHAGGHQELGRRADSVRISAERKRAFL